MLVVKLSPETYEYDVHKVDGAQEPLAGAGFTLFKLDEATGKYVAVGEEQKEVGQTIFQFKGLDSGQYMLEETTVPGNYNKAENVYFTISADYDATSDFSELKKLTITYDKEGVESQEYTNGETPEITIENLTGAELPSTGGIGTTIFYVAGGILVVGAAVMLIAKKRTENEE